LVNDLTRTPLEHVVGARRSCRAFLPDPVPRDLIERILTTAQRSPSWCNTQPWEVIVTSGDETSQFRTALLGYFDAHPNGSTSDFPFPAEYLGTRQERRRLSGWQLYDAVGVRRGDRQASAKQTRRNFDLFGAPHVAIITAPTELGVYGALDCGVYVSTFLLAAEELGLGAIAQAAIANYSPLIRRYFNIPDGRLILLGISFGYRDEDDTANSFRTNRANLSEVVEWVGTDPKSSE
jgi:nitroreductase